MARRLAQRSVTLNDIEGHFVLSEIIELGGFV